MAQEAPASVLCVCLGAKLFARHLKSAHPPTLGSFSPSSIQLPSLKLVCRQWNANKSRWRNFSKMPRRASIYGRQVEILSQAEDQRWREEGQSVWAGGVAVSQGQLPARVINICCCCCCCRGQLAAKIACLLLDFSLSLPLFLPLSPPLSHPV